MRIGGHAVLFKTLVKEDPDYIFSNYRSFGYEGVEIGARFWGTDGVEDLREKLGRNDIELSAMHAGSPMMKWLEDPESIRQTLLNAANVVKEFPCRTLLMSGNREGLDMDADFEEIAKRINEVAKEIKAMGVTLCYHNHDHEFWEDMKIYDALIEHAPELSFAPDVGWIHVGGADPMTVLKKIAPRMHYLHIRDAYEEVGLRDFPALGEGVLDLRAILDFAEDVLDDDAFAVVEFDKGEAKMERLEEARQYLSSIGF